MTASRLETVRRVAVLRTTAARAAVGAAGARRDLARAHHAEQVAELAGSAVSGGSSAEVQARFLGIQRLADDVTQAAQEVQVREQERETALAGWSHSARRARLLDDVCARHRAEHEAAGELRTQHLLDDLAARRGRDPR
jgi:flagellar export protein FliJ